MLKTQTKSDRTAKQLKAVGNGRLDGSFFNPGRFSGLLLFGTTSRGRTHCKGVCVNTAILPRHNSAFDTCLIQLH